MDGGRLMSANEAKVKAAKAFFTLPENTKSEKKVNVCDNKFTEFAVMNFPSVDDGFY